MMHLCAGYGMSETTIAACAQQIDGRAKKAPGSTGVLTPGMEARILLDDGSPAKMGEPGELWLKSDGIALGYWNDEAATKEAFVDGWLRTGDRFLVGKDQVL